MARQAQVPEIHPKLQRTLHLVEKARDFIKDAAKELSSIEDHAKEWNDLEKLGHDIKAHWHLVDRRASQLRE